MNFFAWLQRKPQPAPYVPQYGSVYNSLSTPPGRNGPMNVPASSMRAGGAGVWRNPLQPMLGSLPPLTNRSYYTLVDPAWQLPGLDGHDYLNDFRASSRLYLGTINGVGYGLPTRQTTGNNPAQALYQPGESSVLYMPQS